MIGDIKIDENLAWRDTIKSLQGVIIKMNQDQLRQGKDSKGNKLPPYSNPYAKKRSKQGLQTVNKDLYVTGDFYKGFYVLVFDEFLEIGSKDYKERFLENSYPDIHGLTPENLNTLIEMARVIYRNNILSQIRGYL